MTSHDVIAEAISRPIDWGRLEEMVYAILLADDLPRLRRIGGGNDFGVDAQEETFYDAERKISTIVQVTSQRAQRTKLRDTIAKLKKKGVLLTNLIFVTRHPVGSEVKREMIAEAESSGVVLDIRDDQYLIGELSKPGAPIFARFFGSTKEQLAQLLDQPDPLHVADTKQKHALLATMGAFALSHRGRLARSTLFERTVLSALAAAGGKASVGELMQSVRALSPDEEIDEGRVSAATGALEASGHCRRTGDSVECGAKTLEQFVEVSKRTAKGYRSLIDAITAASRKGRTLDDAQVGYLERNVRRALLHLLRSAGPLRDAKDVAKETSPESQEIRAIVSKDLPPDVGKTALAAFSTFVQAPEGATVLAPLVRSYSALAIRNMDPFGRRWQQVAMARSRLALDTDAVLRLLIKDLPEHEALVSSVRALQQDGIEVVVPEHVLDEAVGHVERADTTFRRFADRLLRLPEAVVDAQVWHAVVRGYYYAVKNGYSGSPEAYWNQYYDPARPLGYIEHILSQRAVLKKIDLALIPEGLEEECAELEGVVLAIREQSRLKASFRHKDSMQQRVRDDVRMLLNLAQVQTDVVAGPPKGYLASEDRAFSLVESHVLWGNRPHVSIPTRAIPQLASFVCAVRVDDDVLVRLLFDPVIVAAAEQMATDISFLASIGVDLKNTSLERLDWDLRQQLREQLSGLASAVQSEDENAEERAALATLSTARKAVEVGYQVTGPVGSLLENYENALVLAEKERKRSVEIEQKMYALAEAARATTKKGRRRINRVLQELGIQLPLPEKKSNDGSDEEIDE